MNFIECCEVVKAGGLRMIRPAKNEPSRYDLKEPFEGNTAGWIWLDATTANIVCQIYDVLSPAQQEGIKEWPMSTILKFCWRIANGQ